MRYDDGIYLKWMEDDDTLLMASGFIHAQALRGRLMIKMPCRHAALIKKLKVLWLCVISHRIHE